VNGLKVIVVENHKLPKVSFNLYVDYPIMKEGDKAGMGDIFGQLLSSGTTNTPKDDFDAKIDYIGATVSTNARGFFASSLKKHTPKMLTLLGEMVISPAFPQDEFDRIIKQSVSALASEKSNPDAMASNVANVVNYGADHPYGEVTTEATLANITLEDIKSHYSKYFIPNQAYLVIVGDLTQEEAKSYVEKYFGSWKKGDESKTEAFSSPSSKGNNVYFVDKPGAVQSSIKITHNIDLKPGHEDLIRLKVLNQILGGGSFSARLMSNLREDKAYTYGCYSSFSPDLIKGEFTAGGNFRNEVTDSAIVQIIAEIEKIANNPVTDTELELVKNSMTGAFARSLERPETMARFALNTVRYNLTKDYYAKYLKAIESVTKDDLLTVAKKYIRSNNLNIVVVGNEEVAEKLSVFDNNGGLEFKTAEGKEQIKLKAVAEGVTAESIIRTYLYKSLSAEDKAEFDKKMSKIGYIMKVQKGFMAAMNADLIMTTYAGTPNKTAMTIKANMGTGLMTVQKEYFNGETGGTFQMGAGKTSYEGDKLEEKKNGKFLFSQKHYFTDDNYTIDLMGIDEVEGKEHYKMKISKKDEEDFSLEYYSVETGWLVMEESFSTDDEGNASTIKVIYKEYYDVKKGVMMPKKMIVDQMGQQLEFEVQEVIIKKKPKSTAFDGVFN
jgi:zinc protease